MDQQFDFKKEWEKTKQQLKKLGQDSVVLAKKAEKEFIKLSQRGKLHVDATAASLKKEHLYYLIGKEYVHLKDPQAPSEGLKKHMAELKKIDKEQRSLQRKMKVAP